MIFFFFLKKKKKKKKKRYHRQPDEGETIISWIVVIIGCAFFPYRPRHSLGGEWFQPRYRQFASRVHVSCVTLIWSGLAVMNYSMESMVGPGGPGGSGSI